MVIRFTNTCVISAISSLTLWVWIPYREGVLDTTLSFSVIFSGYTSFLHQLNGPPQYNWNIVESGVKHHNPNPIMFLFVKISLIKKNLNRKTIYLLFVIKKKDFCNIIPLIVFWLNVIRAKSCQKEDAVLLMLKVHCQFIFINH